MKILKTSFKDLNINWGIKKPILSHKDKVNYSLKDFLKVHGYP